MDQLLDIDTIINENKRQEGNRLGVFESILAQIHALIKRNNKERIREMNYKIPVFIYGKPKYNVDVLRNYLVHHLMDNGLKVVIIDRYHIYISWKETDINLTKYMHRKTLIQNRQSSLYMVDDENGGGLNGSDLNRAKRDRFEMMKFRQERQKQLQDDRKDRFEFQKVRAPLPDMDFKNFVNKY